MENIIMSYVGRKSEDENKREEGNEGVRRPWVAGPLVRKMRMENWDAGENQIAPTISRLAFLEQDLPMIELIRVTLR